MFLLTVLFRIEYIKKFYRSKAKRQTTQDEAAMDLSEWLTAPAAEESRPCTLCGLSTTPPTLSPHHPPLEFSWET